MEHKPLARTVLARWRHSRIFGLGDRAAPAAFTPGLCLTSQDPEMDVEMAPFSIEHNSENLPAQLSITARGAWSYPFGENDVPTYMADEGHTLPPSLQDADSGLGQSTGPLLPVSWQRLVHDPALLDAELSPDIIVIQDAVQLAGHPGRLVQTIRLIRERSPHPSYGLQDWVDPTIVQFFRGLVLIYSICAVHSKPQLMEFYFLEMDPVISMPPAGNLLIWKLNSLNGLLRCPRPGPPFKPAPFENSSRNNPSTAHDLSNISVDMTLCCPVRHRFQCMSTRDSVSVVTVQ